ncbi:hypothetical protein GCM10009557_12400 [Virgisporangium ochraceum]
MAQQLPDGHGGRPPVGAARRQGMDPEQWRAPPTGHGPGGASLDRGDRPYRCSHGRQYQDGRDRIEQQTHQDQHRAQIRPAAAAAASGTSSGPHSTVNATGVAAADASIRRQDSDAGSRTRTATAADRWRAARVRSAR